MVSMASYPVFGRLFSSGSATAESVEAAPGAAGVKRGVVASLPLEMGALGLIVLLGLALRLNGLTSYGIWFDEGYHIELVKLPTVASMLNAVLSNPPSDPLYVLLLRLWVSVFGHGDASIRSLSVILATATLLAIYWLGVSLERRGAGLLGALFFALSPYAVEFGQEAALYGLAALTTTLALAAGFSYLRTGRGAVLYVLLGVVAIYSHYVVAVILLLFAALPFVVKFGPVSRRRWMLLNLLVFAAWVPWLVALILHWAASDLPRVSIGHTATVGELTGALIQYTSGTAALQQNRLLLQWIGLGAGAALAILAVLVRGANVWLFRAILAGAAALFFVPWLLSAVSGRWLFVPHFMLFLLPVVFVVLAAGALHFAGGSLSYARIAGFVVLGLWLGVQVAGLSLYYRYPPHGADGLKELAATLNATARSEPLFVTPPALSATLAQYYPGVIHGLPSDFDLRRVYLPYDPATWNAQSEQRLSSLVGGQQAFWLVYRPDLDQGGSFLQTLQHTYTQTQHESYPYADLYHFIPKH